MINRTIWLVPLVMTLAVLLIWWLTIRALMPMERKNGFTRNFFKERPILLHVRDKPADVKGIVSGTDHHLYFKMANPAEVWVTDYRLQQKREVKFRIPNHPKLASFSMMVDSPDVHIMAGNFPAVIKASLDNDSVKVQHLPGAVFTRAIALGSGSYIFRGYDPSQKNAGQLFIKRRPSTGEMIWKNHINPADDDMAGIRSDGLLSYDVQTGLVAYVSFYRNQFYIMDSNLNLKHAGRTIDTVQKIDLKTGEIEGVVTNNSPARIINGKSRVWAGKLYIESKLRADNEEENEASGKAVIDVYGMENGIYKGSFYLPYYKREKVGDFKIIRDVIVVLYKNYMATYRLKL